MTTVFYIAFIVDHDIRQRRTVVVEAGVDLLAGPYPTHDDAVSALRVTCARHPRVTAFAALAAFFARGLDDAPVRIAVIPVSDKQVARYTTIHPEQALPWPPPALLSSDVPTRRLTLSEKVSLSHVEP